MDFFTATHFGLCTALSCVLKLPKMSVKFKDNCSTLPIHFPFSCSFLTVYGVGQKAQYKGTVQDGRTVIV